VIVKAEHFAYGANPRYVVTSLSAEQADPRTLYEALYCARGDMENRIKEQQLDLFADRTSTHTMRANQLRLYMSTFAYVLLRTLRRLGLQETDLAAAAMRHYSQPPAEVRCADSHQRASGAHCLLRELPGTSALRPSPAQPPAGADPRRARVATARSLTLLCRNDDAA
jgi:hypothetical protein